MAVNPPWSSERDVMDDRVLLVITEGDVLEGHLTGSCHVARGLGLGQHLRREDLVDLTDRLARGLDGQSSRDDVLQHLGVAQRDADESDRRDRGEGAVAAHARGQHDEDDRDRLGTQTREEVRRHAQPQTLTSGAFIGPACIPKRLVALGSSGGPQHWLGLTELDDAGSQFLLGRLDHRLTAKPQGPRGDHNQTHRRHRDEQGQPQLPRPEPREHHHDDGGRGTAHEWGGEMCQPLAQVHESLNEKAGQAAEETRAEPSQWQARHLVADAHAEFSHDIHRGEIADRRLEVRHDGPGNGQGGEHPHPALPGQSHRGSTLDECRDRRDDGKQANPLEGSLKTCQPQGATELGSPFLGEKGPEGVQEQDVARPGKAGVHGRGHRVAPSIARPADRRAQ